MSFTKKREVGRYELAARSPDTLGDWFWETRYRATTSSLTRNQIFTLSVDERVLLEKVLPRMRHPDYRRAVRRVA